MRRFLTAVLFGVYVAAAPSAAQAQSAQAQAVVAGWYNRYLHRAAEPAALAWAAELDQGLDPTKLLAGILGSDEYYAQYGGTIQGYVPALFADITGRQPTPAEYSFWANQLAQVGGTTPDVEERLDLAYAMLTRYPQNWQGAAPVVVAPTVIAPAIVVPPVFNYGRHYGDHDDFEYRKPYVPSVRVDRDHREEHGRHDDRAPKRK